MNVEADPKQIVRQLLRNLVAGDYFARSQAGAALQEHGKDAAQVVLEELFHADVSCYAPLTSVLESIGREAVELAIKTLVSVDIKRTKDVYLVECLMDTLWRIGDRRAGAAIAEQVDRFNTVIDRNHNSLLVALCQHAKVRAHSILSDFGDRSRLDDLIKIVGASPKHLRPEVVGALKEIGDRRALVPLALCFESQSSTSLQEDARDAFREIVRREKVSQEDPMFLALNGQAGPLLQRLYPRSR